MDTRLQVVIGSSCRLRDELLAERITAWPGPLKRLLEPADLNRIMLDLDTPSFLAEAALWVVRCDDKYVKKHSALLTPAIGQSVANGVMVLVMPALDQREKFTKALIAAGALHRAEGPGPKEVASWLAGRLAHLPWGVANAGAVAQALVDHVGDDVDALLAAADVAALYAAERPLDVAAVRAVVQGEAERPLWEFSGALLEGRAGAAIELLHAGSGIEAQMALAGLLSELRKLLACDETSDDGEASAWAGQKGRGNLYYARKRSRDLGRPAMLRLLQGSLHAQRELRRTGYDPEMVLEMLAVNAQRVVRPGR